MRLSAPLGLLAACLTFLAVPSCAPPCPTHMVSLEKVVAEYNANAAAVPQLWARAKIEVSLVRKNGMPATWGSVSPLAAPNGLLLLFKGANPLGPHDFVLIGRETAAMELFRVGSSAPEGAYYLWYRFGQHGEAWWGRQKFAGAPGVVGLPIDPNQLLAVLNVCQLPSDFTQPPTVALTMDNTPGRCAYVLTYIDRQPVTNHLTFRREVYVRWSDREPRLPYMVQFFDNAGVRVMTARLKDYRPIALADAATRPALPPIMPTDIEITWPENRSRVHILLSEMTTRPKGEPDACLFRDNLPNTFSPADITQVDQDLDAQGAKK